MLRITIKFILLSLLITSQFSFSTQLPLKAFAGRPDVDSVTLSPDGKKVASLVNVDTPDKTGTVISVFYVDSGKQDYVLFTDNSKFTLLDLTWANDNILLADTKYPFSRQGTPVTETRLIKIDITSKKMSSVIPSSVMKRLKYIPNVQNDVIDYLEGDDNHLLLSLSGFSHTGEPTIFKINLDGEGKSSVYQANEKHYVDWLTDVQNTIRIGIYRNKDQYKIMERKSDEDDLRELWSFDAFSAEEIWPLGFSVDPNILYVSALHAGKTAVFTVDLKDPKLAKTLVHHNESYDVSTSIRREVGTGKVIGVGNTFWDKSYNSLKRSIDKAIPDYENYFLGFSKDGNTYLTLSTSATEPGIYLLGDRAKKSLNPVAYRYNTLTPDVLSAKQRISYDARDGLTIEGYLTLPKTGEGKNLPTIIFPHGGPISFEGSGFDYWSQFFASRGYAVLQMDFRGSSGYGFDFMQQGIASWGQSMQDDVEDGTRWLISQGVADPDKICILGASYGGYAALMGAIKTPDLYQCAVSFAGVSDVEFLVKSKRRFTNYDIVKKQIGDDFDLLKANSPLTHAEKIKVPVLLMHGAKDRVVRVQHSDDMYDELKRAKKQVTYIELDKGDHYLSNANDRLKVFQAMEEFLAEQLL